MAGSPVRDTLLPSYLLVRMKSPILTRRSKKRWPATAHCDSLWGAFPPNAARSHQDCPCHGVMGLASECGTNCQPLNSQSCPKVQYVALPHSPDHRPTGQTGGVLARRDRLCGAGHGRKRVEPPPLSIARRRTRGIVTNVSQHTGKNMRTNTNRREHH
jgi:hypothetical protein